MSDKAHWSTEKNAKSLKTFRCCRTREDKVLALLSFVKWRRLLVYIFENCLLSGESCFWCCWLVTYYTWTRVWYISEGGDFSDGQYGSNAQPKRLEPGIVFPNALHSACNYRHVQCMQFLELQVCREQKGWPVASQNKTYVLTKRLRITSLRVG